MGEVPVSLHLSKQLADKLADEAGRQNVSVDKVAQSAIESYLEWTEAERELLEERIKEADKGIFVSSDAVLKWMRQLEDGVDAPFPEPDVFPEPTR